MTAVLYLLALQGVIGAFDTLYFHEWKARLPARPSAAGELRLHAARSFLYALLFGTLPWLAWCGSWVIALGATITTEILLTLADFVVEIAARKPLGDVYAAERVTHALMGILYGAAIANLIPVLHRWWVQPSRLLPIPAPAPDWLRLALLAIALGVFLSGARDLYAGLGLPGGAWPWDRLPAGREEVAQGRT